MKHAQMARRLGVTVAVVAIVAAGCSAGSDSTSVSTTVASAAPGTSDATAGIKVPDEFTAVTVRSLSAPQFPFKGSDGKYHIVYDLELTNAARVPAPRSRSSTSSTAARRRP